MMEAARRSGAGGFLFASSIGVYSPAEVFREDDVWKTFPSENDRFAGWAKRMGELQAEAYRIEHGWDRLVVVRPANVYGAYDNFDLENAMVVPSLIKRVLSGEDPLRVWGDGSAVRDFIHARDVARGMRLLAEKNPSQPVNLGSGRGTAVRELVEVILRHAPKRPKVVWETAMPGGDERRVMDTSRAKSLGFEPAISLDEGIRETMEWYRSHSREASKRYDVFAK
jgi:GDP-L-fucose synthase